MSIAHVLNVWQRQEEIYQNIAVWRMIPPRQAHYVSPPEQLHPTLIQALAQTGITHLYTHQAATWEYVHAGANVVIATGTASGKTLAYNLPILDRLLRDPEARALYLFPTKALAQDQCTALNSLINQVSIAGGNLQPAAIYDGDTPSIARQAIRKHARIVFSNPDMLHTAILPHHTNWADYFNNLRFVVLDEIHVYRGVFGSHVANVIRRLKRVAQFYGAHPQFLLTSATIANPLELAEKLIEARVIKVDEDASARGPVHFLIYNPPMLNRELGIRRSALQESIRLAQDLLAYNVQMILFARSRRSVELILTYLRQSHPLDITTTKPSTFEKNRNVESIRGYRSGYLPHERREIERGLRQGSVRAVAATNALELGIDIGGMEAAILVGYPGTISATWQQAGRAGRSEDSSLALLVVSSDPLDQFLAHNPDYFFSRSPEQALIDPDNLLILLDHLRCAAFELPFHERERFGGMEASQLLELLNILVEDGVLHPSNGRYYWMADQYPAQSISLRSASTTNVVLQTEVNNRPTTIGLIDHSSAPWMVHPGAIYIHEGQTYQVEDLDLEHHLAILKSVESDYYTQPRMESNVQLIDTKEEAPVKGATKAFGEVKIISQVVGFKKIQWYTHEILGFEDLLLPPSELITTGYWLTLDPSTVEWLRLKQMWSSDPNNYGPDWKRQSQLARQRDGYRCQSCGKPEQERAHDVHHKIPFKYFKDASGNHAYTTANHLDNLITLCPTCHHRAETAVRIRSGMAGLSYALNHLAPFFLMCDPSDLGVHFDPRSPLSNGQPTVVLYDRVPAGIGFSLRLYEIHDELIERVSELIRQCACADGCPSCVGPCGSPSWNDLDLPGGKEETLALVDRLR